MTRFDDFNDEAWEFYMHQVKAKRAQQKQQFRLYRAWLASEELKACQPNDQESAFGFHPGEI